MILGPNLPPTLSVQVVAWFNDPDLGMRFLASAGAIAQLLVTMALLLSWWLLEQATTVAFTLWVARSEEHTSELQSLMSISYAVFCLKNKKTTLRSQFILDYS